MVQDNIRDPHLVRVYNLMKEDERFIFRRSNKIQRSTLQALRVAYEGHMCLVDHTKAGGIIEFASLGFCDLIGRLPWDTHGNHLIHVLGISNIDEQDERFRVLCSRTTRPAFSSKAGSVLYPSYFQLLKNIEDFVTYLQESNDIVPTDPRPLPMVAGIYNLHAYQNPLTEVVVVMYEVFLKEPDYENFNAEEMHQYRRLVIIVTDIGNVVKELEESIDSIIITNSFSFEHEAVASYLYQTMLKYTNEPHTTTQGFPRIYPIDPTKLGCLSEKYHLPDESTVVAPVVERREDDSSSIRPSVSFDMEALKILSESSTIYDDIPSSFDISSNDSFFKGNGCCIPAKEKAASFIKPDSRLKRFLHHLSPLKTVQDWHRTAILNDMQ
eukprot:GHVH01005577.1.p1 GENE.GHVH01005577.1~~GHVH01005577.1.p1  ORF type:complete len:382 (-),score=56.81 GHVH01005577.1:1063-2208(-)